MMKGMTRISVVTGGSGGIGRAVARKLAARGESVALLARGAEGLEAAAEDVRRAGGTPLPIELDMADFAAVEDAADRIEKELGPIDVWVNDAFSSVFAPFTEMDMDEFKRTTEVSYLGFVHGTKAALTRMLPRDRGAIVQVGSALAYRGVPLQTAYCGAKHAIQGFTESLRCELLHDKSNVHVTMVQMPAVNTPQFGWVLSRLPRRAQPVPPIYQPEIAADAVVYAADHPKRREYWVGGSTVKTLLANAVAPGLLDRYLARKGYESQQTDQPRDADQPANLWQPADGPGGQDAGAHGDFDDQARTRSVQLWASQHHGALATVGGGLLAAGAAWAMRRR
ncbi:MAG TPA: SDR family oxidoreductase [Actinoplanes sp.]|nr:SDR family oxidoreductase [Actinoplanes sp.]